MTGFRCPECGGSTNTVDSRPVVSAPRPKLRRRRHCENGHRFTTYEMVSEESVEQRFEVMEAKIEGVVAAILAQGVDEHNRMFRHLCAGMGVDMKQVCIRAGLTDDYLSRQIDSKPQIETREMLWRALSQLSVEPR